MLSESEIHEYRRSEQLIHKTLAKYNLELFTFISYYCNVFLPAPEDRQKYLQDTHNVSKEDTDLLWDLYSKICRMPPPNNR